MHVRPQIEQRLAQVKLREVIRRDLRKAAKTDFKFSNARSRLSPEAA